MNLNLSKKLLAAILAALLAQPVMAGTKVLKYSDHEPLGNMRTRFIKDIFFAAIEKESKGRLKIEDHWGSEIATGYKALSAVGKDGIADMAIVVPEYSPNELPLHQIFKSFPVGLAGGKQVAFFRRAYAEIPDFAGELKKANTVSIFLATGYPVAFFSTKSLDNLEGVKGYKWRSASFWHQAFLKNAGAVPVSMPWGEGIFKALQDSTLDGLMVNMDSGYDLNVHKAAPNILLSKDLWLGHVYVLVMNKNTWDALSKKDKNAIVRAAETAYKTLGAVMDSSFDIQIEKMKEEGAQIRVLEQKELDAWKTAVNYLEVQSGWVKEQESKGIKNAGIVIDEVAAIINDVTNDQRNAK